jgi:uncharacterized protein YoxC
METNGNTEKYSKGTYFFTMIIAGCSALTFLVILIVAIVVVPKAVRLMNTAQQTLDNMETVSEQLMGLELAETVKNIDENTARAMQDVSDSMDQIQNLDIESLNQSIQDLKESTQSFKQLFER